ncbi:MULTISPECIES: DUF1476 domain-containing protein [Inquilinus]|uniref:DUF1476 domain-containing protein n=1 Tax=Inquilinus ginsengisoli TaxID=363840 RepID=A0ABU1JKS4_9PROT|nr:DUF1476 domain-containing protein [Inquilinus ginsengisoli]MDR6288169.1 hypothetical protein [Inquilinus ginsengisoli]
MTIFGSREQAIEAAFRHDQDLAFRIRTRRNRLLGLWVAELIGLVGAAADAYAAELVTIGVEQPQKRDVVRKVQEDLLAHGIKLSTYRLNHKLDNLERLAGHQLVGETDKA